jgi:hypothetical protein
MKKIFLILILILILAAAILAGIFFSEDAAEEDFEIHGIHGMLTRVTYGENVAYLFGSMHASQEDWFPLAQIVEDAMRRADIFAFETELLDETDITPEIAAHAIALQMLPDGQTLEDILPAEIFENFVKNIETYFLIGFSYDAVKSFTPIAITTTLELIMYSMLGLDMENSVDGYVAAFAQENNRPVIGLNSAINELDIVFNMPLEIQAYALADFPPFDEMLEIFADLGLIEAYAASDLDAIREMFLAPTGDELNPYTELFHHNLLYVRDRIFAAEISRLLRETDAPTTFFVTVGLGHLLGGGAGFVLEFLEEMGFEITPLWR